MLCNALVLCMPDGISGVVGSTRGSRTAATGGALDATSHFGLCVCKSGGGRDVLRVEAAGKVGGLEDHDAEGALGLFDPSERAGSYKPGTGGKNTWERDKVMP